MMEQLSQDQVQHDQVQQDQAQQEAPHVAQQLHNMALQAERGADSGPVTIHRSWQPGMGTYTYHTHVRVACQQRDTFRCVADCFFQAARLPYQPWYTQFVRGELQTVSPAAGAVRACLNLPVFDFGLGKLHAYRQLLSAFEPDADTCVLVLRSVHAALPFRTGTLPAFTLSPTGDVLHLADGILHWHHICTVAGVGVLPGWLEKPLMNALRFLRLDGRERQTYREEAGAFIRWLDDETRVQDFWQQHTSHDYPQT